MSNLPNNTPVYVRVGMAHRVRHDTAAHGWRTVRLVQALVWLREVQWCPVCFHKGRPW